MGKKKAAKPGVGSKIQVCAGVTMPEAPQFEISGLTGEVVEVSGKGAAAKFIIQWDRASMEKISPEMRQLCEANGWLAEMVCLTADQVSLLDTPDE